MTGTTTYSSWQSMLARCNSEGSVSYPQYGGAGIKVCERWHKFHDFFTDMGTRPPGTSLDRIDNAKGYEPGNCRWATRREQNLNRKKFKRGKVRKPVTWKATGRPRGRPPIDNPATDRVGFRCTPDEKESYRKKAGDLGISAWLKELAEKAS